MAGRSEDSIRHFLRIAERRLAWAEFLAFKIDGQVDLPAGLATNFAVESAAMTVDCALKALILASRPGRGRRGVEEDFRGSKPHNPEWLKDQLEERGVSVPRSIVVALFRMRWRTHDHRYDLKIIPRKDAAEFLAMAALVVAWARGRI